MKFVIDNMFPRDLAEFFIAQGHDAATTRRLGMKGGTDPAIWQYTEELDAVLVTQDSDFLTMVNRSRRGRLLHYRGGNTTTKQLILRFEAHMPAILEAFKLGERIVEFR